jgi:hypothetical protein
VLSFRPDLCRCGYVCSKQNVFRILVVERRLKNRFPSVGDGGTGERQAVAEHLGDFRPSQDRQLSVQLQLHGRLVLPRRRTLPPSNPPRKSAYLSLGATKFSITMLRKTTSRMTNQQKTLRTTT